MLRGSLRVDLPSQESEGPKGALRRVRALLGGRAELLKGRDEVTASAFAIVEALVKGFSEAAVTNAVLFLVDDELIYLDPDDEKDDLERIITRALGAGILERRFEEMHLVLSHREDGLHTLYDAVLRRQVARGEPELVIDVAGRIEALRAQRGETAKAYVERVRRFALHDKAGEAWRLHFHRQVERVAAALARAFPGGRAWANPSFLEVTRLGPEEVARFRALRFGDEVEAPVYRATPAKAEERTRGDPFHHYFRDPHYDLACWALLSAVEGDGAWHGATLRIVEPSGEVVATARGATLPRSVLFAVPPDAVTFTEDGGLYVDEKRR